MNVNDNTTSFKPWSASTSSSRTLQLIRQFECGKLIFSVFKTLTDQRVTVELKNDLSITGVLKSVDQYVSQFRSPKIRPSIPNFSSRFLNIRLDSITVLDEARHPHMVLKACFFYPISAFILILDGGEKLLYSGFCSEVCAATCRACRYAIARGRDPTR